MKMIDFHSAPDFVAGSKPLYSDWIYRILTSEGCVLGSIDFIFCDDEYLLELNRKYLSHDTLTDIITFDYTQGSTISGDVFISLERVRENAEEYGVDYEMELQRVMSHGLLHLMGYGDKTEEEANAMRKKEDEKIKMFHVEQ